MERVWLEHATPTGISYITKIEISLSSDKSNAKFSDSWVGIKFNSRGKIVISLTLTLT